MPRIPRKRGKIASPPRRDTEPRSRDTVEIPENSNDTDSEIDKNPSPLPEDDEEGGSDDLESLDAIKAKIEADAKAKKNKNKLEAENKNGEVIKLPEGISAQDEFKEILKDCLGKERKGINSMTEVFFYGDIANPIFLWEVLDDGNVTPSDRKMVLVRYYKRPWNSLKTYVEKNTQRTLEEVADAGFVPAKKKKKKESNHNDDDEENDDDEDKKSEDAEMDELIKLLSPSGKALKAKMIEEAYEKMKLDNEERRVKIEERRDRIEERRDRASQNQTPQQPQMMSMMMPKTDETGKIVGQQMVQMPWNPYMNVYPPYPIGGSGGGTDTTMLKQFYEMFIGMMGQLNMKDKEILSDKLDQMQKGFEAKIASMDPLARTVEAKKLMEALGGNTPEQLKMNMEMELKKLEFQKDERRYAREEAKSEKLFDMAGQSVKYLADTIGKPMGEAMARVAEKNIDKIAAQQPAQQVQQQQVQKPAELPAQLGPPPPPTQQQLEWLKKKKELEVAQTPAQ